MCTRVVYSGKNGMVATGRSMDWKTEMHSNLWVFPKGMERNGETGTNSLKWTSKYGSVVTSAFEIASTDGMNEKGLVANLLWLPEAEYPIRDQSKPGLAITAWVQYMLDNFATVGEAVAAIDENTFQVVSDMMPCGSGQSPCPFSKVKEVVVYKCLESRAFTESNKPPKNSKSGCNSFPRLKKQKEGWLPYSDKIRFASLYKN